MDFLETAYQFLVQKGPLKRKLGENQVSFEEVQKRLEILSQVTDQYLSQNAAMPLLVPSRDFVGGHQGMIYLPEKIDLYASKELNCKAYLHLLLSIRISGSLPKVEKLFPNNNYQQRLAFLNELANLNRQIDGYFPHYLELQKTLIENLPENLGIGPIEFKQLFLSRNPIERHLRVSDKIINSVKRNAKTPEVLQALIPCYGFYPDLHLNNQAMGMQKSKTKEKSDKPETEKKKQYSSLVEKVDLEKEKANPVTHSFEKLETLDEYSGGRRFDSGDDDLQEHSEALDELNLSKMTRDGETAKSIFRSEEGLARNFEANALTNDEQSEAKLYDEWNYAQRKYRRNYCRLLVNRPEASKDSVVSEPFDKKQVRELQTWRRKINTLLSRPIILRRLLDGDELDYDEFVRDFSQAKAGSTLDGRWYARKKAKLKDASVMVLFDQSMSSDSWVQNHRVLDVILESLKMTGALFDKVVTKIAVAGTCSETRHNCYFNYFKDFEESWAQFYKRVDLIQPSGYTRLGPAIRHATDLLAQQKTKDKILILITDAKPTDLDGYEGNYGVQDIKIAGIEAEGKGVKIFALAIDVEAKSHFSKMFKHFSLLTNPEHLAEEMFKFLLLFIKQR